MIVLELRKVGYGFQTFNVFVVKYFYGSNTTLRGDLWWVGEGKPRLFMFEDAQIVSLLLFIDNSVL